MDKQEVSELVKGVLEKNRLVFEMLKSYDKSRFIEVSWKKAIE